MGTQLSYSYIYEEDDPEKNKTNKLGELLNDKAIYNSAHVTEDVKVKNKLIREAYF